MHIPRSFVSIKFQFVADKNNFCARETWMELYTVTTFRQNIRLTI